MDRAEQTGTDGAAGRADGATAPVRCGEHVSFSVDGRIGTLRLERPPMNAIDAAVRDGIREAVAHARSSGVGSLVVVGSAKVFAAGADIKEMAGLGPADVLHLARDLQGALDELAALPVPTVAAITGYALGGGFELALACDFRVVDAEARVGLPEITLGLIPGGGGTQRLARLVGSARTKDLVFSGRMVGAEEALALGLADEVAPAGTAEQAARARVARYVNGAAVAVGAAKDAIDHGLDGDLASGLQLERALFAALFGTRDAQHGLASFVERGPGKAEFEGR
ncbi:enoyl-CoA hydratase/isomerase family protein [Jannaschia sp. R86511]|uniref:enoyl-CoA hydratase/isomerase family protein n=1 Tax=Jannaschia sp. R86511 TaxID=3093853 RepID=UPI0036D3AF3D